MRCYRASSVPTLITARLLRSRPAKHEAPLGSALQRENVTSLTHVPPYTSAIHKRRTLKVISQCIYRSPSVQSVPLAWQVNNIGASVTRPRAVMR